MKMRVKRNEKIKKDHKRRDITQVRYSATILDLMPHESVLVFMEGERSRIVKSLRLFLVAQEQCTTRETFDYGATERLIEKLEQQGPIQTYYQLQEGIKEALRQGDEDLAPKVPV